MPAIACLLRLLLHACYAYYCTPVMPTFACLQTLSIMHSSMHACMPDCYRASCGGQVNCESEPLGPENPHAIGFCSKETDLTHELAAIRNVNTETSRIWKIKNYAVKNRLTGVTLRPPITALSAPDSQKPAVTLHLHYSI